MPRSPDLAIFMLTTDNDRQQLELKRAHTPRAAVSTTFTYILCQVVRISREHMVGSVHRRGQQNAVFATLVGLAKQFEAY